MIANKFNSVFFPQDLNGTGQWRGVWPIQTIWAQGPDTGLNISIMPKLTLEQQFYSDMNVVMIQRYIDDVHEKIFNQAIVPYSNAFGFWTVYNIDDAMHYKDIVKYNQGRRAFTGEHIQSNIKSMLNNADFVLTTTDYIKEYYHKTYGVPLENIIAIPNYLPNWWIGGKYNKEESVENFKKFKNKPRIGMISSLSHYNIDNIKQDKNGLAVYPDVDPATNKVVCWKNENGEVVDISECTDIPDDLDIILDCILKTVDDFQWVFFGYAPPKLEHLIKANKIEYHPGIAIVNYPNKLKSLKLNAIVAPLQDGEFNRCKSNIKYLEAAAIGVPLFAQNLITYSKYMPANQLFDKSADLYDKLLKLKFMSAGAYESMIEAQWKFLNTPHNECGIPSHSWWMEENLSVWMSLFGMKKKSQEISLARFIEFSAKENEANANTTTMFEDGKLKVEI